MNIFTIDLEVMSRVGAQQNKTLEGGMKFIEGMQPQ